MQSDTLGWLALHVATQKITTVKLDTGAQLHSRHLMFVDLDTLAVELRFVDLDTLLLGVLVRRCGLWICTLVTSPLRSCAPSLAFVSTCTPASVELANVNFRAASENACTYI